MTRTSGSSRGGLTLGSRTVWCSGLRHRWRVAPYPAGMLKACLNGARRPSEHRALPMTAAQIAIDAGAVVAAGADALHVHPKDGNGADTLDAASVAAVVTAVRGVVPGVPVGVTTGAWSEPDPGRRVAAVAGWTVRPDFASVNWHEPGAPLVAEVLLDNGVGVEAGLWNADAVASWLDWPLRARCTRILLEVVDEQAADDGVAVAVALLDALGRRADGVPVLLHGEGTSCWPVFNEAVRRGLEVRVGLEDTLTLPDGRLAKSNAQLVTAARATLDRGLQ
jgi:uncharacterized protein (DUF849 family)